MLHIQIQPQENDVRPATILPLTLVGVCAKIRGKTIVGPIDLTIGEKGVTAVIGPNGSGKTTVLRVMHGLQRATEGTVKWTQPDDIARARQSYVFQTPIMMRRYVVENIAYPLLLRGVAKKEACAVATEWAQKFGLGHALDRPAPVLSGGEKQKLSLARALITKPDIIFLDEPTANLDGRATREIETILQEAQGGGTRVVIATHDMGQARRLASDVVFMYDGKVHEAAAASDFFAAPQTKKAAAFIEGRIVE